MKKFKYSKKFLVNSNELGLDTSHIFTKPWKILSAISFTKYYFKNNTNNIITSIEEKFFEATNKSQYTFNIKNNNNINFERIISEDEFYKMINEFCGIEIMQKTCFYYLVDNNEWEISFYPDFGYLIAEIKYCNKAKKIIPPFNFEKEITNDLNYNDDNLTHERN